MYQLKSLNQHFWQEWSSKYTFEMLVMRFDLNNLAFHKRSVKLLLYLQLLKS